LVEVLVTKLLALTPGDPNKDVFLWNCKNYYNLRTFWII